MSRGRGSRPQNLLFFVTYVCPVYKKKRKIERQEKEEKCGDVAERVTENYKI